MVAPPPSGPVGGIVFDLDGCLIDSEIISLQVLSGLLTQAGIPEATPALLRDQFMGVSLAGILETFATRSGRALPPDLAHMFEAEVCRRYRSGLNAMAGARELLVRLAAAGMPVAIATGSSIERMHLALGTLGLDGFFPGTACSTDEVAKGKPAPDLFYLAARRMGVDPQHCAAIDDSPHGITGARRAGMRAYGFVGGSHLDGVRPAHGDRLADAGASAVLHQFADLPDLVLPLRT